MRYKGAMRPWWYPPRFARRWYAKPAAWINKNRTFVGRQMFCFCCHKRDKRSKIEVKANKRSIFLRTFNNAFYMIIVAAVNKAVSVNMQKNPVYMILSVFRWFFGNRSKQVQISIIVPENLFPKLIYLCLNERGWVYSSKIHKLHFVDCFEDRYISPTKFEMYRTEHKLRSFHIHHTFIRIFVKWCICSANMMLLHFIPQWCDVCHKM